MDEQTMKLIRSLISDQVRYASSAARVAELERQLEQLRTDHDNVGLANVGLSKAYQRNLEELESLKAETRFHWYEERERLQAELDLMTGSSLKWEEQCLALAKERDKALVRGEELKAELDSVRSVCNDQQAVMTDAVRRIQDYLNRDYTAASPLPLLRNLVADLGGVLPE